jgi:heterodisulfide reductase subunit B
MSKIGYYPGCTLKSKAKNLEDSALACLEALDVETVELPRWNCCGAVFSLADDDLIHHIAPVRDLVRAKDEGHERLITLCSMCYNTLARANLIMADDDEKRDTINRFMDEETDYAGEVKVLHYLDYLRTDIGWDKISAALKRPLEGLKVAPYYGCTLLRPREVSIESPDTPTMFGEFVQALGAELVTFPESTACCSSYQVLANESAAFAASAKILKAAADREVDALVLTCPVCEYNLGRRQDDIRQQHSEVHRTVPTLYFTQLLAVALGLPREKLGLQLNEQAAVEMLEQKSYVQPASA